MKKTYELRQVDAWDDGEGWTYNETWPLVTYRHDTAYNDARAMHRALNRLGITCNPGRTATEYDGDVIEIVDRKTGRPLFVSYCIDLDEICRL